jgi:DNA polymerase-4
MIWKYANGIEDSAVSTNNYMHMKGIGNSTTISFDVKDQQTAHRILLSLTETVAMRLRNAKSLCQLVSVSIKNSDFRSYSHQKKFFSATDCTNEIFNASKILFNEAWKGEPIRHLGVRVSELCSNEFYQKTFFDDSNHEKNQALDSTIDNIRLKFGSESIFRASFLNSDLKPMIGGVGAEDFPMISSIL